MIIELDDDVLYKAFRKSLKWHYDYLEKYEGDEDNKELREALKMVYNYYSPPSEHIE